MSEYKETQTNAFGDLLRKAREEMGLSLREAEKGCGISNPMLSQYESGHSEPSFRRAIILCIFYGIDLKTLANAMIGFDHEK